MKPRNYLLAFIVSIASLCSAQAQTNAWYSDLVQFLGSGSNWMVAPYGIYDTGSKTGGAGAAALYEVTENIGTGIRVDAIGNGSGAPTVWMPSFNFQLQVPVKLFNKVTLVPFALSGVATPIAGKGADNKTVVGLFGAGAALKMTDTWYLLGDYEKWTGFDGNQLRLGFLYRF